uniref:F-box domain-containing protein n=1 Tax=Steinernema glaseri TaxID=37863 RepID=A0A1I7Z6I5_9BILA
MSQTLRRRRASELVNQPDVLLLVLARCEPVTVSRCRNVCRRWRYTIDEALAARYFDDQIPQGVPLLRASEGHARIVICDRRRAILERINEDQDSDSAQGGSLQGAGRVQSSPELYMQPLETTLACVKMSALRKAEEQRARRGWTVKKTTFWKDQYAHQGLAGWSFKFDLSAWTSGFEVDEVWLENFGSFLERSSPADQGAWMGQQGNSEQEHVGNPFPTPPHSQEALKEPSPRANAGAPRRVSPPTPIVPAVQKPLIQNVPGAIPTLHGAAHVPYNMLPSTQVARTMESEESRVLFLDEQVCADMARISGGRFERLVQQLKDVSPLHVVFKDHSLYPRRPTMLLFWFLKQLRANLRKVTFDNVQGEQRVKLENVMDLSTIEELNIVQPPKKPAIDIDADTLTAFAESRSTTANPRPFRLRICGKTGLTAEGLLNFVKKWQNNPQLARFDFIQVDTASVSLNDWIEEVTNNSKLHQPCENDLDKINKIFCFRHPKFHCRIRYRYENGYLFFQFANPTDEVRQRTVSSSSKASSNNDAPLPSLYAGSYFHGAQRQNSSASSFYSSSSSRKNSHDRRYMQNEYEIPVPELPSEPSVFHKFFNYILRSNA